MDENINEIVDPIDQSELELKGITIIDVDMAIPFQSVVHCKQYDTVRVVEAHLLNNGEKWYIPEDNV